MLNISSTGKYDSRTHVMMSFEREEEEKLLGDQTVTKEATVEIVISSIRCSGCVGRLEEAFLTITGVIKCNVNIVTKTASVTFDSDRNSPEKIVKLIQNKGYQAFLLSYSNDDSTKVYFKLKTSQIEQDDFMDKYKIEIKYIKNTKDHYKIIELKYKKKNIGIRTIVNHFHNKNINLIIIDSSEVYPNETQSDTKLWRRLFVISAIFGTLTMILMIYDMTAMRGQILMILPGLSITNLLLFLCATTVKIFVGRFLYISAYRSIFTGINMDFLISTAAAISYIYSCVIIVIYMIQKRSYSPHTFFETSGMLYMILSLGRWIENYGKVSTIESIKKLMRSELQEVRIMGKNDKGDAFIPKEEIYSNLIQENDYIMIYKGMRIPADGTIEEVDTMAEINESILTGESHAVYKLKNAEIMSGSINEGLPFIMKVIKTGEDCTLQQISRRVEEALSNKVPMTDIVNVVSKYFTPTILVLAIITFLCWTLIFYLAPQIQNILNISSTIQFSFQTSISVLCVACPCALGLAIPLAVMVATGVGAKHGIFIKGGEAIRLLSSINTIVFDKTGTLTNGKPIVSVFTIVDDKHGTDDRNLIMKVLYSLTSKSSHVLSIAIKNYLITKLKDEHVLTVFNYTEPTGRGITCEYDLKLDESILKVEVILGNSALMSEHNVKLEEETISKVSKYAKNGSTIVFASFNKILFGYFVIDDEIRSDAITTISYLKESNIKTIILSGDRQETTKYVANKIGIDEYFYQQLPEDKSKYVDNLIKSGEKVAMVGDGVNDIIAISRSTVGIAMGSGSNIAAETANVVLMSNKLFDIINLLELSYITIHAITRNLILSSIYNILAVPIAAGCFKWAGVDIQPWVASIAMVASSLSVTGSSLIIKLFKPKVKVPPRP